MILKSGVHEVPRLLGSRQRGWEEAQVVGSDVAELAAERAQQDAETSRVEAEGDRLDEPVTALSRNGPRWGRCCWTRVRWPWSRIVLQPMTSFDGRLGAIFAGMVRMGAEGAPVNAITVGQEVRGLEDPWGGSD